MMVTTISAGNDGPGRNGTPPAPRRSRLPALLAALVMAVAGVAGGSLALSARRARDARSYVVSARSDGVVEGVRLIGTPRAELHRRFGEPLRVESIDGTTIDLLDRAYMRVVYSSGGVARHASVDFAEHRRDVGGRLTVRLEHHGRTVPLNRDATEAEVVAAWPDAEPVDMSHLYTPEWRRNYPPGITRRWLRDSGVLVTFQDGKATELSFPALNLY